MKLSNFTSRSLIAIIALGMGLAVLLFSNFSIYSPGWIKRFDATCIQKVFSSKTRVTTQDSASKTVTVRSLKRHPDLGRTFQPIIITDDPARIFEDTPPTPLDYAIILQKLYDRGHRHIAITTRMSWDKEPSSAGEDELTDLGLSIQALSAKLAQFDRAIIGLPVTRGANDQQIPEALKRAIIPFKQSKGNNKLIPAVNQVSLHANISGGSNTLAGFHRIESAPESKTAIPLIAQWKISEGDKNEEGEMLSGGFIPSIGLLTIMSAHNVSPSEIDIVIGQHIRLGESGPVIPIDEYGQTPAPQISGAPDKPHHDLPPIHAEELISHKPDLLEAPTSNTLCLIHAKGTKTAATNLLTPERLDHLLYLSKNLPTPGEPTHYQKLTIAWELLVILLTALIIGRLATLSAYSRNLAFAITLALVIITLLILMEAKQQWFGLTAPVVAILTAWITSSQLKANTQHEQKTTGGSE